MPESFSALLLALMTLGATGAVTSRQSQKPAVTNAGCLQHLETGQKDLPPVHICSSGQANRGKLGAASVSGGERDEPEHTWIVLWHDSGDAAMAASAAACQEAEAETTGRFNGTCAATFNSVYSGLSVRLTHSHLMSFLSAYKELIASVHQDGGVSPTDIQYDAPWALDRIDQDFLPLNHEYTYSNTGSNVNVYIVDTGIRTSHDEFKYADGRPGSRAREVFTSLSTGEVGQDCGGHGTHVAASVGGLTFGAAKNVTLLAVRALDCSTNSNSTNTGVTQVVQGLEWVKENYVSPAVVVMALGGDPQYALDLAVAEVVRAGVAVLVAAGNGDTDACLKSPAREPLAITVSATDQNDSRVWAKAGTGANYGSCVDIWAPGNATLSASNASDNATEYRSGTSQAVPCIAGAAALYLQNNTEASPLELNTALMSAGSWGVVHEPQASGPLNADVLDDTDNVMVNTAMFHAVTFQPQSIQITGAGGVSPFFFNVTLAQKPSDTVVMAVGVSNTNRADVNPPQLTFSTDNWSQPQQVNVSTAGKAYLTVDSSNFYVQLSLSSNDSDFNNTHPRLQVSDSKGNTAAYPKAVLGLPFSDQGNSYFFTDDYEMQCSTASQNATGGSKDVVYFFQPQQDCLVTIATCNSAQFQDNFDTILYVLGNATGPGAMQAVACNDDACSYFSRLQMNMTAGSAYAVVLDGYNGLSGKYQIDITAEQGSVNGSMPPLDLAARISVPQTDLPPPGPTATPEAPPGEEEGSSSDSGDDRDSLFEIEQASPAAFTVPIVTPLAAGLGSNMSNVGGSLAAAPSSSSGAIPAAGPVANGSSPATAAGQTGGLSPNSPAPARQSPLSSPESSPRSPSSSSPSPRALTARRSPSPGAPVAPLLIPAISAASMAPAVSNAPEAAHSMKASVPTALSCQAGVVSLACPPVAAPSSFSSFASANTQAPLASTPTSPTTTTYSTSPASSPTSSAMPRSPQVTLAQSLASQATPASPSSLRPPTSPLATSPSPSLASPYTYGSNAAPVPAAVPRLRLPYGVPLPEAALLQPAPAPATAPVPAPAPGPSEAALAPAAATASEAAPSSGAILQTLLTSETPAFASPAALTDTTQSTTAAALANVTERSLAPAPSKGPGSAGQLSSAASRAGGTTARADASVRPAGESSGKGGLGAKDIGFIAGAFAAAAVLLSLGLYVQIAKRRKRSSSGGNGAAAKEAAAESRRADGITSSSQPALPIAQSQQPQPARFEAVGCPPRLDTPGSFSSASFRHSITSSNRSSSMKPGKLMSYPNAVLGAKIAAFSQTDSHQASQQAQQAGVKTFSNPNLINTGLAQQAQHASPSLQHAQQCKSNVQHAPQRNDFEAQRAQQSADDSLYQEAAAAEAALGSFSRASSYSTLQSCQGPASATSSAPLPGRAETPAQGPPVQATPPSLQAAASCANSASHQRASQQLTSQSGVSHQAAGVSQSLQHPQAAKTLRQQQPAGAVAAAKELQPGRSAAVSRFMPQQGYPGGVGDGPRGSQPAGLNGPLLTQAQVKALTSLEVARQRQANRAQLHVGLPAQSQGPFSRQPAGQVQARGQLQAAGQSQPFKLPRVASRFDPAQQARAKLDAIRNELGVLEKARKSMLQQPDGLVSHLRGSTAQPRSALPPTVPAGTKATLPQPGGSLVTAPKLGPVAEQKHEPSSVRNGSHTAGHTGAQKGKAADPSAVTHSRLESRAATEAMSWNPVRLTSPFEKGSQAQAGGASSQAAHRSGWSLHSITFSTANAAAAKESKQLTLSQMTWSMEQARPS